MHIRGSESVQERTQTASPPETGQNLIHQANETGFVGEQKRQRKITLAEEEYK